MFKAQSVKCSKCGKKKFANGQAYEDRVKKYGSVEKMLAEWQCRECKKGVKPEEVVKEEWN